MAERTILDRRTDELGRAIYELRQHLDIFRVISLNVEAMKAADASESFWAHLQHQAQVSMAIVSSAIFEKRDKNFVLSSIPAIILDLPETGFPQADNGRFEALVKVHGGKLKGSGRETIHSSYCSICMKHKASIDQLSDVRNKRACHLEFGWKSDWMPSSDEMEKLWSFANDIYAILHSEYNDVGPALMPKRVQIGLVRTMSALGVKDVVTEYAD